MPFVDVLSYVVLGIVHNILLTIGQGSPLVVSVILCSYVFNRNFKNPDFTIIVIKGG